MKIETFKKLINIIDDIVDDKKEFSFILHKLFELYEEDNETFLNPSQAIINKGPDTITTFADICPCNPKNGGSGICGCTMGNSIINRPYETYYWTTTTNNVETKTS